MKRLIAYLFIVLGLGLTFSVNANANSNNLKSGIEINKDQKVKYLKFGGQEGYDLGYFYLRAYKINDLRGDGVVYYKFMEKWDNTGLYYRLNEDYEVISKGNFQYKKNKEAFELDENNQIFLWKVSMSSGIVDINSKFYNYEGFRRYEYIEAEDQAQKKIYSSIKTFEDTERTKIVSSENIKLKSGIEINKKDKVKYSANNSAYWQFTQLLLDDLRGDGLVYYLIDGESYYRLNKSFKILSKGQIVKKDKVFELIEGNKKFTWKISLSSEIIDIKSKEYDFKGFRRFEFLQANTKEQSAIKLSLKDFDDPRLKTALKIDKKDKVTFLDTNASNFWSYVMLIDDFRGKGPVYYQFNIDRYIRMDRSLNYLSEGTYEFDNKKRIFTLKEPDQEFLWKISLKDKIVDIKSKFYDFSGFKRFHFVSPNKAQIVKVKNTIKNFRENRYADYDDSDDNLNRLYKLIMTNENFLKKNKYLKYSKKRKFNGSEIKTMALAVFINYEKELSKLTEDKYLKKIEPFAWGWEHSYTDTTAYSGFTAIQKCYSDVRKKKISLRNGECIVVDFRRLTGDGQYPVVTHNYLIKERDNRILIAKNVENSKKLEKELLAKQQKEAKEKEKQLQLAQKEAEEERKKQEKLLLAKKKEEEENKKKLLLAQIEANEKKIIKDKVRYTDKKMLGAFLESNEIIIDDLRGDGKIYYQFENDKYVRLENSGKIISEGKYKVLNSGTIRLTEDKTKFSWKLSVSDGVIDIKSKVYPYDGYRRFGFDFIYKKIAKENRKNKNQLAKTDLENNKTINPILETEEDKKVKELQLAQEKAEEERKKQELILAEKKAEEERKKQELIAQKKAEEESKKQKELAKKKAEEEEKIQKLLAEQKKKKEELLAKLRAEEEAEIKKLELAKIEAEKEFEKKKKVLEVDKQSPEILVPEIITVSNQVYKLKGKVVDTSDFFLEIDGQPIKLNKKGEFEFEGFVIDENEGEELTLVAVDRWNNVSERNVKINVEIKEQQIVKTYEKLLPNKIKAIEDDNKIALVIGVEKYENLTNLDAIYANRDAKAFRAYANRAFGIPMKNIKVLIDKEASRSEIIKATKLWLPQVAKGGGKEIYIFFAGHGLASDDGENLFLLPQDGDSLLLEDTAISRLEIFNQVAKLDPKSVTIFFDTCYSGQTRSEETLIAGLRPIRLIAEEKEVPDNFTIFSASNLTQTSGSIDEARHGIFSYYLMKGLEGNADSNLDNSITNGELITYLKENVGQEAFAKNRQQEPTLNGDPNRVILSY